MTVAIERVARNVCSILINRPAKRNAINSETFNGLVRALGEFQADDRFKVAIIGGLGDSFCSGYDLNEIVNVQSGLPNLGRIESMLLPMKSRLCDNKITIAAIHGHAAGFGFELALRCDFRVADKTARLGFLNRRFGLPILNGGTVMAPKMVGLSRARELIATGKAQLAPEALQHGIVNYIADVGCSMGRSLNLARNLAKFPQEALIHDIKQLAVHDDELDEKKFASERAHGLDYLRNCQPLEIAVRFLKGELCRHGRTDLGNLIGSDPEVTL